MRELSHFFHIPLLVPVTLFPRYFGVPLYWSLQFIKTKDQNNAKLCTKIYGITNDYKADNLAWNEHTWQLNA